MARVAVNGENQAELAQMLGSQTSCSLKTHRSAYYSATSTVACNSIISSKNNTPRRYEY